MTAIAWTSVLVGGAFLGAAVLRAVIKDAQQQKRRHLGLVSDGWRGFERQDEERRVDALRHRQ